jgi:hypothetical protein
MILSLEHVVQSFNDGLFVTLIAEDAIMAAPSFNRSVFLAIKSNV